MSEVAAHDKKVEPAFSGPLKDFEAWLYEMVYEKIPFKFPKSVNDVIVQFGPWIMLVLGLLMLPALFGIFTIGTAVSVYGVMVGAAVGPMYYVAMAVLAVQTVIMFVSIAPLLKRKRQGWLLMFYASTISLVYTVLNSFSYGYFAIAGLVWGVIAAAIGYYVIFQIRSYYKS